MANPVSIGNPTKKSHYDVLYDGLTAEHSEAGVHKDDVIKLTNLQHGTAMLGCCEPEEGHEAFGGNGQTWETLFTYKVYIPTDATTIKALLRARRQTTPGDSSKVRFGVGGSYSNEVVVNWTTYAWIGTELSLDVSSLSGWQTLVIQAWDQSVEEIYVQGYSFYWA